MKKIKVVSSNIRHGIRCGVYGEFVELNELEARHISFKLCPECIKAIKWVKLQMKSCDMSIIKDGE